MGNRMKTSISMPLLVGLIIAPAMAGSLDKSCLVNQCDVGTKVTTYSTQAEPYLACPSRELAGYTTTVLGLISTHISLTGKMPNISDRTGEPEYLDGPDGPNQTRLMLDRARSAAGVRTFDQAAAICQLGKGKQSVTVMNNPENSGVLWVKDSSGKTYWMPKSHVDKK